MISYHIIRELNDVAHILEIEWSNIRICEYNEKLGVYNFVPNTLSSKR